MPDIGLLGMFVVCAIVCTVSGWFLRRFFDRFRTKLKVEQDETERAHIAETRTEILRLIDEAIKEEDLAFEIYQEICRKGEGLVDGKRWESMQAMKKCLNKYDHVCRQIEDMCPPGTRAERFINSRRAGLNPFEEHKTAVLPKPAA